MVFNFMLCALPRLSYAYAQTCIGRPAGRPTDGSTTRIARTELAGLGGEKEKIMTIVAMTNSLFFFLQFIIYAE